MSNELESFIQQHKAKLAEEKNDLQQVHYALSRLFWECDMYCDV